MIFESLKIFLKMQCISCKRIMGNPTIVCDGTLDIPVQICLVCVDFLFGRAKPCEFQFEFPSTKK